MTNPIELWIPELPPGLNGGSGLMRMHWTKKKKLQGRWDLYILAKVKHHQGKCPQTPLKLTYTRCYAKLPMDLDNAAASIKIPLDGLVHSGLIPDDNPSIIGAFEVRQRKVPRMIEQGIWIRLETMKDEVMP